LTSATGSEMTAAAAYCRKDPWNWSVRKACLTIGAGQYVRPVGPLELVST